ncbi:hypothetical protein [Halobellus ordinarius]|uniref:hypothetical protein n=1 Tax=Halobellus ordinarius TaxID=3075120 RepID=UPI0028800E7C|nr:hypothetical protein [Halobellus sp. ZY16]
MIDEGERGAVERVLNAEDEELIRAITDNTPWTLPTVSTIIDRRAAYKHGLTGGRLGADRTLSPALDPT